jgi:hypothetical protein
MNNKKYEITIKWMDEVGQLANAPNKIEEPIKKHL